MGFALRYGGRDFPLVEGRFLIGRSEDCQLCVDDPMASRNHAAIFVQDGTAQLEDLQSRNGVYLNDERVSGRSALKHGDKVRVGSQEMVFLRKGSPGRADTLVQRPVTARMQAFGVLGGLADKALNMGRGDEAERILGRQLESFLDRAEKGGSLSDEEFERSVEYALRIAKLTRAAKWVSFLFRMHATQERLMDAEAVNELYSIAPKLSGSARAALRTYVATLREAASGYGPAERFVMKRLEGLEQALP